MLELMFSSLFFIISTYTQKLFINNLESAEQRDVTGAKGVVMKIIPEVREGGGEPSHWPDTIFAGGEVMHSLPSSSGFQVFRPRCVKNQPLISSGS